MSGGINLVRVGQVLGVLRGVLGVRSVGSVGVAGHWETQVFSAVGWVCRTKAAFSSIIIIIRNGAARCWWGYKGSKQKCDNTFLWLGISS